MKKIDLLLQLFSKTKKVVIFCSLEDYQSIVLEIEYAEGQTTPVFDTSHEVRISYLTYMGKKFFFVHESDQSLAISKILS